MTNLTVHDRDSAGLFLSGCQELNNNDYQPTNSIGWFLYHWVEMHNKETKHFAREAVIRFLSESGSDRPWNLDELMIGHADADVLKRLIKPLNVLKVKAMKDLGIESREQYVVFFAELYKSACELNEDRLLKVFSRKRIER